MNDPIERPGRHIVVTHLSEPARPAVWRRRALHVAVTFAAIALGSWRWGFTAVGVVLTAAAVVFLTSPSTRRRLRNSALAAREDAWVSAPLTLVDDGRTGGRCLFVVSRDGIGVIDGIEYRSRPEVCPWPSISFIRLEGPELRPVAIEVDGCDSYRLEGPISTAALDQLARYGVPAVSGP